MGLVEKWGEQHSNKIWKEDQSKKHFKYYQGQENNRKGYKWSAMQMTIINYNKLQLGNIKEIYDFGW